MIRSGPSVGLIAALASIGIGCDGTTQSLSIGECLSPAAAVGAEINCKVLLTDSELDCSDPTLFGRCKRNLLTAPAMVTQATVNNTSIFQVLGFENDSVRLGAVGVGDTTVQVTAPDTGGQALTASASISARAPDGMRTKANCLNGRAPKIVALPTDVLQGFTVELLASDSTLASSKLPAVDGGALTQESAVGATLTYRTPTAPTETQLTSADFADFAQQVRVYDVYGVTGLSLIPRSDGPYPPGMRLDVDVALRVEDEIACSERTDRWAKTVTVEPSGVCTVADQQDSTVVVSDPPLVQIETVAAGTCNLSAVSDSTGHRTSLTLTVSE